ncbi:MAG: S-methyl-5-thioribose-1-phosphate isomerase [Candidatus Margulisiibacteriota bacterium]|jgi:S-methyl-5-thioribose-1-phosphate isomerase
MKVNNKHYRTIWAEDKTIYLIDQNQLPFNFEILEITSLDALCLAIKDMNIRGAGAIGAAAGYAMALGFLEADPNYFLEQVNLAKKQIEATRPTAQNLFGAVKRVYEIAIQANDAVKIAFEEAEKIALEDMAACQKIGEFGAALIQDGFGVETHCNAGWLAFVDYGSALAPFYQAKRQGKQFFVYVDETRPRNQGAKLTAWELSNEEISHAIIADNAGAHYMSRGKINLMIVGADRIAANGDTANKIGTLEKAICAKAFGIPFYIAAPLATIDLNCPNGSSIPIEERSQDEVLYQKGVGISDLKKDVDPVGATPCGCHECYIRVSNPTSSALNPGFDVTPAEYITGLITEKGIIKPSFKSIQELFSK